MALDYPPPADDLFNDALELAPTEREAFLSRACRDNEELRSEIRSLLAAHDDARNIFQASEAKFPGDSSPGEFLGRRIGPYRLEELIAAGGMGQVYRAMRADEGFRQEVAVKIIHRDIASPALVRRFCRERQALADLNHPAIARLLDGGSTADGLPYLVMELISGIPIDRFCDDRRLDIDDRLKLFLKVCGAVGHAHRHLVVHRDLKPANILVTSDGHPKLLDFGIAKLLQADTPLPEDQTLHSLRLATPRYASPEQLLNQPVSISCDVYSLGLILYELLSGLPARDPGGTGANTSNLLKNMASPSEAFRKNPSEGKASKADGHMRAERRRANSDSLRRLLRGDLDAIVTKATSPRPEDRYNSVEQLERDVRSFVHGLPVSVREASSLYRTAKFVRRNAIAVSLLALVILFLTGAALVSNVMRLRAREAEARANSDRNEAVLASTRARRISRLLEETILSANPYRKGSAVKMMDVLDDIAHRVTAELVDEPVVAAELNYKVGQAYANLWKWEKALSHADAAVKLTRGLPAMDELVLAERLVLLGRAMTFRGMPQAEQVQREALEIRLRRLGPDNFDVGDSKICLAYALWSAARPSRPQLAEQLYREGIETLRHTSAAPNQRLAISLLSYAALLSSQNRPNEAGVLLKEAWEMYRALPFHEDRYMVACQIGYASALERAGRVEEARDVLTEALRLVPDGLEDTFTNQEYQRLIQKSRHSIAKNAPQKP